MEYVIPSSLLFSSLLSQVQLLTLQPSLVEPQHPTRTPAPTPLFLSWTITKQRGGTTCGWIGARGPARQGEWRGLQQDSTLLKHGGTMATGLQLLELGPYL